MQGPVEKQFHEIFDLSSCEIQHPPQTAYEKWMYGAPIYNQCTILGEMPVYLLVAVLALAITVGLLVRKYKKTNRKSKPTNVLTGGDGTLKPKSSTSADFLNEDVEEIDETNLGGAKEKSDNVNANEAVVKEAEEKDREGQDGESRPNGKKNSEGEGELLVYRLTATIMLVPLLSYVLLLFVGLGLFTTIIKSTTIGSSPSQCQSWKDEGINRYNPVSFKLIDDPYELAVLKMERNETGPFAHLNHTILFTYGKGGSVTYYLRNISHWAQQGFEVFAWDYPGFGFSKGPGQPADFVAAQTKVLEFVSRKTDKPIREIILYAFSMGGAVSTITAKDVLPKRVILANPLDALANVVVDFCRMTGSFAGPAIGDFLDARDAMVHFAESGGCLMMFAGGRDQMIMYKRHRATYMRFYEHSKTFCGLMVYEDEAEHHADPWSYEKFNIGVKKFFESVSNSRENYHDI